ncbi:MFS transporter [Acinetobacter sp. ANC 4558]|uniref:MFS transporter n=1 Tax=Acinetobacter sp. ANC 4558 TaxID=1977876 RepID=UPI000A349C54|nr:MFS transporter [Acinetobacter sp. ANC 4558]OTG83158.1 MFS transporter [Acinetobacter sp. ANC 4558]
MLKVTESENYIEYGTSAFTAVLVSLFLAGFAIFSCLYCIQPLMPILADFFKVSVTQSSFPLSISTIALAFGLLITGFISDYFGRKPVMVIALFSVAILLLISAFLPFWSLFLVVRVFIGIAVSGVAAVAMTYIGEEIAQKDIGLAMGLYISGTAIGGMGGRFIAGVLVDFVSWQAATAVIGLINLIIAFIFYKKLPASRHFQSYPIRFSRFIRSFKENLKDSKLKLLFLQGFILMGCFVSVFNYMSFHLLDQPFNLSQVWIGCLSLVYLAGIYSAPRAAEWGRKWGRHSVLPWMLVLMMFGVFLMYSQMLYIAFAGLLIFTFAFFAGHSTASSWVSVQALQYKAVASSLYLFSYYLGSSLLGSVSGLVWEYSQWNGLLAFMLVLLFFGVYIAWRLKQLTKASSVV